MAPRRENQLFAVLAFALAIWAFGDGAYNLYHTVRAWEFWVHFQAPGEILFPTLFVHLALVFTEPPWWKEGRARKPILAALYIPAAFALVAFYSTTWVFRFKPGPADTLTIKGWLYWGYAVFSYASAPWSSSAAYWWRPSASCCSTKGPRCSRRCGAGSS